MTTNNTQMGVSQAPTPMQQPQPKKSKAGKVILWVLLVVILLVGAGAGGWYLGQMNKNKEVEKAKQDAQASHKDTDIANNKNQDTNNRPAHEQAPPKTATETTCNADELSLAVQPSAESGAGTIAYDLVLTNTSKRTCILGGFPGISLVNDNGNMIGSPAERATNYEEKKLTLAPNTKVKAVVYTSNSSNFSDGQCKEGATKFRVYPPNDTGYLSVATTVDTWCPGFTTSPVVAM